MEQWIIKGNIIDLAKSGKYDVVVHGCNCFCLMGAGLAPQMAAAFGCDDFNLEQTQYDGDINKLGNIDYETICLEDGKLVSMQTGVDEEAVYVTAVNAYTQYEPGPNADMAALDMCLQKLNHTFKGEKILLPQIGCGIGGLNWKEVLLLIKRRMADCEVTIVLYDKN